MIQSEARQQQPDARRIPDGELLCILCGSVVADAFGKQVVHRAGCPLPLRLVNGRPRCCKCGGALICEPVFDNWGSPWVSRTEVERANRESA